MLKISYCGRVGSFSYEAATKMFPQSEYIGYNTFNEAVEKVSLNEADYAVIPIENSSAGRVAEIHNILPVIDLPIVKEYILPVVHNLYVYDYSITIDDIHTVRSHPQALMQCSKFLSTLKDIKQETAENTAIAAEELKCIDKDRLYYLEKYQYNNIGELYGKVYQAYCLTSEDFPLGRSVLESDLKRLFPYVSAAVICSKSAGEEYNLHLLKEGIQDSNDNYTTFIAVGRKAIDEELSHPITSIIFTLHNQFGSIYNALGCFANNNVNLLKLESYIAGGRKSQDAKFFLTLEGDPSTGNAKTALEHLYNVAKQIKVLGVYNGDNRRFQ